MSARVPYRGAVVTLLVLVLLVTPPHELLSRKGAFADTRADIATAEAIPVDLRDGLRGNPGDVVPMTVGNWSGVNDTSWRDLQKYLAHDSLLVRDYSQPGFYYPVQVMILTARHARAFHNPEVCFSVQGGDVRSLESTTIPAPAAPEGVDAPVGRMLITYPNASGEPPRLVYNLYVVERHDAAADRTTWIRLSLPGVNATNPDALEPFLTDLLGELAPYLFQGTGRARTTLEWVGHAGGWPLAGLALVGAVVPVAGESWWLWRRRDA